MRGVFIGLKCLPNTFLVLSYMNPSNFHPTSCFCCKSKSPPESYNSSDRFSFPSDDSTDVGEEDSFLGQVSGNGPAPSTFNYFSSPATTADPFSSIGQPPALSAAPTTAGPVSVPGSVGMAPAPPSASHMNHAPPPFGGTVYQNPMGRHTPPPPAAATTTTMTPPPPLMQQQSHNPYRHTPTSSRASPYIPAPEVLPPGHAPQQNPYSLSSQPQTFPPTGPPFAKVGLREGHGYIRTPRPPPPPPPSHLIELVKQASLFPSLFSLLPRRCSYRLRLQPALERSFPLVP